MNGTHSTDQGQVYVLSGPSGAGKSTIIRQVRSRVEMLGYSVSHTTRMPRPGERNGVHYHFVSTEEFERMIEKEEFVEWAKVYDDYYGTSKDSLYRELGKGLDVLMDVDPQGATNIKKHFPGAVLIFVVPPALEVLKQRLQDRGADGLETMEKRLNKAASEIREALNYDYVIINDELDRAVDDVVSIIRADRCRTTRQYKFLQDCFGA